MVNNTIGLGIKSNMDGKSFNITEEKIYKMKEVNLFWQKVGKKVVEIAVEAKHPKVITIDRLFNNNDQLKTDTALQMKDAGIDFKVV